MPQKKTRQQAAHPSNINSSTTDAGDAEGHDDILLRCDFDALLQRCIRTYEWLPSFATDVLKGYKKLLRLKKNLGDWDAKILSPSIPIDMMWRLHILDTKSYEKDCTALCGRVVHYDPDEMLNEDSRRQRVQTTQRILLGQDESFDENVWYFETDGHPEQRARIDTDANTTTGMRGEDYTMMDAMRWPGLGTFLPHPPHSPYFQHMLWMQGAMGPGPSLPPHALMPQPPTPLPGMGRRSLPMQPTPTPSRQHQERGGPGPDRPGSKGPHSPSSLPPHMRRMSPWLRGEMAPGVPPRPPPLLHPSGMARHLTMQRARGPMSPQQQPASRSSVTRDEDHHQTIIDEPTENDVLLGRGRSCNSHVGNQKYLVMVAELKAEYKSLQSKANKTKVSHDLVNMVHEAGGRFLEKDPETDCWVEINKKRAREKASQALREKHIPVTFRTRTKMKLATDKSVVTPKESDNE